MNTKIEHQKEIANEVLEKLKVLDPNSALLGGAPRNWHFEEEANDLDFYCHPLDYYEPSEIEKKLIELGIVSDYGQIEVLGDLSKREQGYSSSNKKGCMNSLDLVLEFEYKGQISQLMLVKKPPLEVLEEFSCDICMFSWDGEEIKHSLSEEAIKNKTITFREGYGPRHKCVKKMREYYPDYTIKLSGDKWKDYEFPSKKPKPTIVGEPEVKEVDLNRLSGCGEPPEEDYEEHEEDLYSDVIEEEDEEDYFNEDNYEEEYDNFYEEEERPFITKVNDYLVQVAILSISLAVALSITVSFKMGLLYIAIAGGLIVFSFVIQRSVRITNYLRNKFGGDID